MKLKAKRSGFLKAHLKKFAEIGKGHTAKAGIKNRKPSKNFTGFPYFF